MDFLKEIKNRILVYDGSKGYMLQKLGMKGGECPELWNVEHADEVRKVYTAYKEAGADVIQTNTFQGNRMKLEEYSLGDRTYELNFESAKLAKEIMGKDGFVAASIGPIGILFEPSGELTFEKAYETFKEQVKALVDGGVDIINFETFTDLAEMRAALIAAKEVANIPVICSVSFEANGRTLMGQDPYTVAVVLKSLGADMIGTNCSLGPFHLVDIIKKMNEAGGIPLSVKPNAGLPEVVNGQVIYSESPEKFASLASEFAMNGARLIGGCCGTTPEHIQAIKATISSLKPSELVKKCGQIITSGVKSLNLENIESVETGEIDLSKDNELLEQLQGNNVDVIIDKAIDLACGGYEAIYINVDQAKGNEKLLADVVNVAQGYIKEPFIIETADSKALEQALRLYRGKAGVVVNGYSHETLEDLLKVAKKYGSTVVDTVVLKRE
ncbi:MAG: homocysteine S-methyltransferase family protein [Clostridia bacterium]|nr:homocysteine S-methyltransferase family protein [Clostridia bacterium]